MTQATRADAAELSEADLQRQHESLRRGLRRVNVAWVVILTVLVVLAVGLVWKGKQAELAAQRANAEAARANLEAERANEGVDMAHAATSRAENELWNAKLNEARFRTIAGGPGGRLASEALVSELVQRGSLSESQRLALRRERIAQL